MSFETILVEKEGGVFTILLNRPQVMNAVNRQMVVELSQALEEARVRRESRVVVLKGAGDAFCSGDDLEEKRNRLSTKRCAVSDVQSQLKDSYLRVMMDLLSLRKPVIAALHGYAAGSGLDIALACDIRVASKGTKIGAVSVTRGLGGEGAYLLPRMVGLGRATEMMLLGEMIDAQKASDWGLIHHVVEPDQLENKVQELANYYAKGPTGSYALIKAAINQGQGAGHYKGLEYGAYSNGELAILDDAKEGPKAFVEKREPIFKGY